MGQDPKAGRSSGQLGAEPLWLGGRPCPGRSRAATGRCPGPWLPACVLQSPPLCCFGLGGGRNVGMAGVPRREGAESPQAAPPPHRARDTEVGVKSKGTPP